MLPTSTVTAGKAVPKITAELLQANTETYVCALLLCAFRNATLVITVTPDELTPSVTSTMVTSSELLVKPWMLLLRAVLNCSKAHRTVKNCQLGSLHTHMGCAMCVWVIAKLIRRQSTEWLKPLLSHRLLLPS